MTICPTCAKSLPTSNLDHYELLSVQNCMIEFANPKLIIKEVLSLQLQKNVLMLMFNFYIRDSRNVDRLVIKYFSHSLQYTSHLPSVFLTKKI